MRDDKQVTVDNSADRQQPSSDQQTPPQQPASEQPAPPKRRGMPGNAKSMIISMLVVAAAVLGWNALVPRVEKVNRPGVDVAGIARETNISQKWTVSYPQPAPKGWIPANVRVVKFEKLPPTWQAGYDLPDSRYIAVLQTDKPDELWRKQQTNYGTEQGTVQAGGATWTKYYRPSNKQVSIVRSEPLNGMATIVTGKADWDQLVTFAGLLKPAATS